MPGSEPLKNASADEPRRQVIRYAQFAMGARGVSAFRLTSPASHLTSYL